MKKQLFQNLGRIIGKAVIVASLACPIVFSSCSKLAFDDTELKESIKDLSDRLTALEEKLNDEITALTSLINSKVTVVEVTTDEQTGDKIIKLSNGDSITVYAKTDLSGMAYLTVKEGEDGVYYWATCTYGSDPKFLEIDGKKVPVVSEGGKNTLTGKIENGKYYVSIDGENWVETGIAEQDQVIIFTAYIQDDDYVYLTLGDENGTVIKVAKDKDVKFSILVDELNLTYGRPSEYVVLTMEGVVDYTITEKPEGWKASVESVYGQSALLIQAPKEGVGETEGYIKMLATFENASPAIAKIYVSVEPDFVIKRRGEMISITLAEINVDNYDYSGYIYGVLPESEYSSEAALNYFSNNYGMWDRFTESLSLSIRDLVGDSFDEAESYVVFAINWCSPYGDEKYTAENIRSLIYIPQSIKAIITEQLDNANVDVTFSGYEGFYAGCELVGNYDPEYILNTISYGYAPSDLCTEAYSGSAGLICGGYDESLKIGTSYILWILPYDESGEYTEESFKTYEFTTLSLSAGGVFAAPAIEVTTADFSSVKAQVTAVDDAYKTYAIIYLKDAMPETDEELIKDMFASYYTQSAASGNITVSKSSLDPGTEVVIVAVAVGEDGKYGTIAKKEAAVKNIVFNENLKVTAEATNVGMTSADIKLTFEGTATEIKYWCQAYVLDNAENSLITNSYTGKKVAVGDLVDNTVPMTNLILGRTYYFYVVAFDEDGNPSHMATTTFVPSSDIVYIKKSDEANWSFGQPSISNEVWGEDPWIYNSLRGGWYASSTTLEVDVTMGENCKKAYVYFYDSAGTYTEVTLSDKIVADVDAGAGTTFYGSLITESGKVKFSYANPDTHIYVVWVDSNDQYHTYYEYTPTYPEKPDYTPESN